MVGRPGSDDPTALEGFAEAGGVPEWEGVLRPGDLLYIPRGWVHEAKTSQGGPSGSMVSHGDEATQGPRSLEGGSLMKGEPGDERRHSTANNRDPMTHTLP